MKIFLVLSFLGALAFSNAVLTKAIGDESNEAEKVGETRPQQIFNIWELADRLNLNSFLLVIDRSNLTQFLISEDALTVFIPTNDAFDRIPPAKAEYLRNNPKALQDLLKYHVVQGAFPFVNLTDEEILTTADNNLKARFNIYNHTSMANISTYSGAVVSGTYLCSNGFIHVINQVLDFNLIPTSTTYDFVKGTPELSKLAQIIDNTFTVVQNRLKVTTDPHTLFAPNDFAIGNLPEKAFQDLLKSKALASSFVKAHLTQFGSYFSNGLVDKEVIPRFGWNGNWTVAKDSSSGAIRLNDRANVVSANNHTLTGVVHIIDAVTPPWDAEEEFV